MLIWIASYPCSNELCLLDAMHRRYGFTWFEADLPDQSAYAVTDAEHAMGKRSAKGPWRRTYEKALDSDRVILARTNLLPRDPTQPFIYVSRCGMQVVQECARLRDGGSERELVRWILGPHLFGNWSFHYNRWTEAAKPGGSVFLKSEELLGSSDYDWRVLDSLVEREINTGALVNPALQSSNVSSLEGPLSDLYRTIHGSSAEARGYPPGGSSYESNIDTGILLSVAVEELTAASILSCTLQNMAGYIDSLEASKIEETERLRAYIDILKKKSA